jgi:hypothetical protein
LFVGQPDALAADFIPFSVAHVAPRPCLAGATLPEIRNLQGALTEFCCKKPPHGAGSGILKHNLREAKVTYVELAKRLKKRRLKETEASIANKI